MKQDGSLKEDELNEDDFKALGKILEEEILEHNKIRAIKKSFQENNNYDFNPQKEIKLQSDKTSQDSTLNNETDQDDDINIHNREINLDEILLLIKDKKKLLLEFIVNLLKKILFTQQALNLRKILDAKINELQLALAKENNHELRKIIEQELLTLSELRASILSTDIANTLELKLILSSIIANLLPNNTPTISNGYSTNLLHVYSNKQVEDNLSGITINQTNHITHVNITQIDRPLQDNNLANTAQHKFQQPKLQEQKSQEQKNNYALNEYKALAKDIINQNKLISLVFYMIPLFINIIIPILNSLNFREHGSNIKTENLEKKECKATEEAKVHESFVNRERDRQQNSEALGR